MIKAQTCPICDKELVPGAAEDSDLFPFCSSRCKSIDFQRWCRGEYTIVGEMKPEDLELLDDLPEDFPE